MSFSIIIPTMWIPKNELLGMVHKYARNSLVGEILIINNCKTNFSSIDYHIERYRKVRILNDGNNLFVNPSWNLGVCEAKCNNIILANDDICIPEIDLLLSVLNDFLSKYDGVIIGAGTECFKQRRTKELNGFKIYQAIGKREYGFGVFMALAKESYIPIPEGLKVWYGDTFLYNKLIPYLFEMDIKTNMRSTSKTLDLGNRRMIETKIYESNE